MKDDKQSRFQRLKIKSIKIYDYVTTGVWEDPRQSWKIDVVKTLNLSVRGFLDGDLQSKACAMTYRTILAVVPAFALVFAIGRGFGFQNLLQTQLFNYFPAQRVALESAFKFVDSYLSQASEGIFVGIGIVFLLWTLIGLMSDVESSFNDVWNVKNSRSFWRKLTDYTAILMVLPILLICSGGIQVFMSSTVQTILPESISSPLLGIGLDILSWVFSCLFFAGSYMLIPNTSVKFKYAIISGTLAGIAFNILQWLFVTGQMYVTKYNAIYGSFSFLPLFMIWLQLVWLITLIGAIVCYSSQNIFRFSFEKQIKNISITYLQKVTLGVLLIISRRFEDGMAPLSSDEISRFYKLPPSLVDQVVDKLINIGLITYTTGDRDCDDRCVLPTSELSRAKLRDIIEKLDGAGCNDFIPGFEKRFASIDYVVNCAMRALDSSLGDTCLGNMKFEVKSRLDNKG